MIRKLPSGKYRLYSRKTDPKTGKRRNLGTFSSRAAAEKHERAVQYFKRHLPSASFPAKRRPFRPYFIQPFAHLVNHRCRCE
jgi:hypothetical protein